MLSANLAPKASELKHYKRFRVTENGVSPRTIPGAPGGMFVATGLEHDELGKPAYDQKTHTIMTEKRHRKLKSMLGETPKPVWYGDKKKVKVGVLSWGSTVGAAREAVDGAREAGIRAAALKTVMLNPMHTEEIRDFIGACERVIVPETNHTGQFATLLGGRLGSGLERLTQVTGLPFPAEDILKKIKELAK